MKIYVRKVLGHDITHEVSVTTNIVKDFFENEKKFKVVGKVSKEEGIVTINSATDPRFGGDFKKILREEGDILENDIILIYKYQNYYEVEVINQSNEYYKTIIELTKSDVRHSIIIEDENLRSNSADRKEEFKNWLPYNTTLQENTINNYIRYINYIKTKGFTDIELYKDSNIDDINELITKFKTDDNYISYNIEQNRIPINSLSKYKSFLESNEIIQDFIKYYEENINNLKLTMQTVPNNIKEEFLKEYPIEIFKEMKIEEYSVGLNDDTTFCRKIEFGKYKQYGVDCSNDARGSAHWGVYYSQLEKTYKDSYNNKIENIAEYWEQFRNQLYLYLKNFQNNEFEFLDKYPMLKNMTKTLPKLCFMYYPDKFLNFIVQEKIKQLYKLFKLEFDEKNTIDKLSYNLNNFIRNNVSMASKENSEYLSQILWDFKEFISSKLDKKYITGAFNKIYYGVPGCGKSYKIEKDFPKMNEINEDEKYFVERTTFHPEYSNSDFVGQIIPSVKEGKINYIFHPGAFTLALEYALKNPTKKVCLIIEEINRGNASAIFGDIFQLLDRNSLGESKYGIFNGSIIDYIKSVGININEIKIPSNMWIVGTMNTSDQNVFTLDTAFKRRWKMEYIKNDFSNNKESLELKNKVIPLGDKYPNVTWEKFVKKINEHILADVSGINGEDKQLGMYFVTIEEIENQKEFAEKILSYIWEDVAKLNTTYWFGNISSYDELLEAYNKDYLDIFNTLFEDEIKINEDYTITNVGD